MYTYSCNYSVFVLFFPGQSQSGKSYLTNHILGNLEKLFGHTFDHVLFIYKIWQDLYKEAQRSVPHMEFVSELSDEIFEAETYNRGHRNLLIIDDHMTEMYTHPKVVSLFSILVHHCSLSVIFISHNAFFQTKNSVSVNRNLNYYLLTRSPRDQSWLMCLARQMFPACPNYLMDAYSKAMDETTFSHLLIDLTTCQHPQLRLRTNIFDKYCVCYVRDVTGNLENKQKKKHSGSSYYIK